MGDSYEKVKESERVEAIRERARIVVDTEKRFPKSHRYHRFLHFVEAADSEKAKEIVWEGVTNRVTQVVRTKTREVTNRLEDTRVALADRQDRLEGEMGELNSKFALMDDRLKLLDSKLDTLLMRLK